MHKNNGRLIPNWNFVKTSRNVRLDDGHILRASLPAINGGWRDAEIDLNEVLQYRKGMLVIAIFLPRFHFRAISKPSVIMI